MPPEAAVPPPAPARDERRRPEPRRPWYAALLGVVVRVCDSIARTADRVAAKARAAAGMPPSDRGRIDSGDVVTDDEIDASRRLFGLGAPAVDTTPDWTR